MSGVEADIFSGIPRVTGIPRDGKQNHYESRDWDGGGKYLIGSGRTGNSNDTQLYTQIYLLYK